MIRPPPRSTLFPSPTLFRSVLRIDLAAPAPPRRVMAVEERGAHELHCDGLGQHAAFRPPPVGDEPPQVRPRLPVRAPQLPLRDLGHDAGIGGGLPWGGPPRVPRALVPCGLATAGPPP